MTVRAYWVWGAGEEMENYYVTQTELQIKASRTFWRWTVMMATDQCVCVLKQVYLFSSTWERQRELHSLLLAGSPAKRLQSKTGSHALWSLSHAQQGLHHLCLHLLSSRCKSEAETGSGTAMDAVTPSGRLTCICPSRAAHLKMANTDFTRSSHEKL